MKFIFILILALVGYNMISNHSSAKSSDAEQTSSSEGGLDKTISNAFTSISSKISETQKSIDHLQHSIASAPANAVSTAKATLESAPEEVVDRVQKTQHKMKEKVEGAGGQESGCGSVDKLGNMHYCFNDEK